MLAANERRRYNVTSSLIDWAHTHNDLCNWDNVSLPVKTTPRPQSMCPLFSIQTCRAAEILQRWTRIPGEILERNVCRCFYSTRRDLHWSTTTGINQRGKGSMVLTMVYLVYTVNTRARWAPFMIHLPLGNVAVVKKTPKKTGIVLCMRPANVRPCYFVTSSPIGLAHAKMIPDNSTHYTE